MARIRTIKPGFFRHRRLFLAEKETGLPLRLAFAGLWTVADREGRFRWEPEEIKIDCLPYDDDVDFSRVLDALATRGHIVKYASDGRLYGYIPSWKEHQVINTRESASTIPEPNEINDLTRAPRVDDACPTRHDLAQGEGKGREEERNAACAHSEIPPGAVLKIGTPLEIEKPVTGPPATPEAQYFERGKEVLGPSSGGMLAKLLRAKDGNIALARSAIELASTKQNPREYIGAIIRGVADPPDIQRVYRW